MEPPKAPVAMLKTLECLVQLKRLYRLLGGTMLPESKE
jgi:hypothetical protein